MVRALVIAIGLGLSWSWSPASAAPPTHVYLVNAPVHRLLELSPEDILSRDDCTSPFDPESLFSLVVVDGRRLDLPVREGLLLVALPRFDRTSVVWSRVFRQSQGLRVWTGQAWLAIQKPRSATVHDHAGVLRQLRWVLDEPAPGPSVWVLLDEGTSTDALATREAAADETTSERLLEHGAEIGGLRLAFWVEEPGTPSVFNLLIDNPTDRTVVRPFRTARLTLVGRSGDHEIETPLEFRDLVRTSDIGPGGVASPSATTALTVRFGIPELRLDPEHSGVYAFHFRLAQAADDAGNGATWSGTLESNPVALAVTGWIAASEAVALGATAPKRVVPREEGAARPGPRAGDHVSGRWLYRVSWRAEGSRSESVTAALFLDGRLVRPDVEGGPIRTPFGRLRHEGRPPDRFCPFSSAYRGRFYGRRGWFVVER